MSKLHIEAEISQGCIVSLLPTSDNSPVQWLGQSALVLLPYSEIEKVEASDSAIVSNPKVNPDM